MIGFHSILYKLQYGMESKDVYKFIDGIISYYIATGESPSEQLIDLLDPEKSYHEKFEIMVKEYLKVRNEIATKYSD